MGNAAKPWYTSKTMWASIITTLAPVIGAIYPPAAPFFPLALSAVGIIFGALRTQTSVGVTLKK